MNASTINGLGGTFELSLLAWLAPLLILSIGGIAVLTLEAFANGGESRRWVMWLSALTSGIALIATVITFRALGPGGAKDLFDGMVVVDRFSVFMTGVVLVAALLSLLLSADFLREHGTDFGEYYPLVLFATAGMVILVQAGDLVTIFLGVETMSLAVYVLTGSYGRSRRSSEAAMKYFLTGAFATAILVYGIALVYGAVGSTNLIDIGEASAKVAKEPIFLLGQFLLIAAFAFKIAAVPFHMWAPDTYEGAPTPVTTFMAAGVKAAGIAAILRVFLTSFGGTVLPFGSTGWATILAVLSAVTMTVGNIAALRQENIKRMLAYSSISHAGYLLIGVVAAGVGVGAEAQPAILFYLLAYTFTTVGSFGIVAWIGNRNDERLLVDDWAGLASKHPAAALAMTVFLLSLAGMPPTAGFFGKFYIFRAAMDASDGQLIWLVLVAVANSLVSVFYYLRPIMAMYFREPSREHQPLKSGPVAFALIIACFFVLEMGVLPNWWLEVASSSGLSGLETAAQVVGLR